MWNVCCFLASTRSLRLAKCEVRLACTTVKRALACITVKCVWHAQLWSAFWHTQLWSTLWHAQQWSVLWHAQLWSVLWHAQLWSALWYAQLWSALWHAQLWSALWHAQLWSILWHTQQWSALWHAQLCISLHSHSCTVTLQVPGCSPCQPLHTAALSLYKSQDAHLVSHSTQLHCHSTSPRMLTLSATPHSCTVTLQVPGCSPCQPLHTAALSLYKSQDAHLVSHSTQLHCHSTSPRMLTLSATPYSWQYLSSSLISSSASTAFFCFCRPGSCSKLSTTSTPPVQHMTLTVTHANSLYLASANTAINMFNPLTAGTRDASEVTHMY